MVIGRTRASMARFRDDEGGAMSLIIIFTFLAMIIFGGIAVDVMRFETRRVAMQQTLDRGALAAASLTQIRTPQDVVESYVAKADLGEGLVMVDFGAPTVTSIIDTAAGVRRVSASAQVTSKNFFMGIFSPVDTLGGVVSSRAEQGMSQIEVMLVLDVSGSMAGAKIKALKEAAKTFVDIVKDKDALNGVSIGVVPYKSQVLIPEELRKQFTVKELSSWDGVPDQGVPGINCFEFPLDGFNTTGVSLTTPITMAAVADVLTSANSRSLRYVPPQAPVTWSRDCSPGEIPFQPVDPEANMLLVPTKDAEAVKETIDRMISAILSVKGDATVNATSVYLGMRWGTALLDEDARPIYDNLRASEPGMAGRPADNDSVDTRKIIVLMTDGENSTHLHIIDEFKTGISPIWRTANNRFAIRYTPDGPARTNGTRPGGSTSTTCSGWVLSDYANREFFVPDLKRNSVPQKLASDVNEVGTGTLIANACDPRSWIKPTVDSDGSSSVRLPIYDTAGAIIGYDVATQLDWSEVWRYLSVGWVAEQLYGLSGVTNTAAGDAWDQFRAKYPSSPTVMDNLLQTNCTAARTAGMEVYGIAFSAPPEGQTQIRGCSSEPKENYYFEPNSNEDLIAVFEQIATQVQDLRLTQ